MESDYCYPIAGFAIKRIIINDDLSIYSVIIESGITKTNFPTVLETLQEIFDMLSQERIRFGFVIDLTQYTKRCYKIASMFIAFLRNNKRIMEDLCNANVILIRRNFIMMHFIQNIFTRLYKPVAPLQISDDPNELIAFMNSNNTPLENIWG